MAGPISNHGGLGMNGSKAGAAASGLENKPDQSKAEGDGQSAKVVTDEVSLSAAAKQLNAHESSEAKGAHNIETPEQAAALAKNIASAMQQNGPQALAAMGSNISGLKGLLMSA